MARSTDLAVLPEIPDDADRSWVIGVVAQAVFPDVFRMRSPRRTTAARFCWDCF